MQGDIYGLGVLLYQLIAADGSRPVAHGWERDVADPLVLVLPSLQAFFFFRTVLAIVSVVAYLLLYVVK